MNVLDTVGNTPLVEIKRMNPNPKVKIFAKLERFNPTGSVKDRIAKYMIEAAEQSGLLTKDKIILEATSGNTGIGLAFVAAVKGYKVRLIMPEHMSKERMKMLRALGADLILTPKDEGVDGAQLKAKALAKNPKYFLTDQFGNQANVLAHYEGTGAEILRQTRGKVTMFVAGMGTGGTLMGVGKRLKEFNSDIKTIGVEPYPGTKIAGLKNMGSNFVPPIFNESELDEVVMIKDKPAFETARELARREGLFVGVSAGAAMYVAMQKAKKMKEGVIVVLFADGGEKYLSTTLYSDLALKDKMKYGTFELPR